LRISIIEVVYSRRARYENEAGAASHTSRSPGQSNLSEVADGGLYRGTLMCAVGAQQGLTRDCALVRIPDRDWPRTVHL